jgi:fructose-1,6-bisphosphatase/inositol monophosphatase family enzyme
MWLPWLGALPDRHLAARVAEFVDGFCTACDALPRWAMVPGVPTANIEWRLENRLLTLITGLFGHCRILAEEHFSRYGRPVGPSSRLSLLLDPLDGSASFTRGSERYASSVAVLLDGRPLIGLVYAPARRELYSALAGHGAWLGGQRLGPAVVRASRVVAVKAERQDDPMVARRIRMLTKAGYSVERMESTSLKLCWLANGRRAGVFKWLVQSRGLTLGWGTFAGVLICQEAGLVPRRLSGALWTGGSGPFVVADARCQRDLRLRSPRRRVLQAGGPGCGRQRLVAVRGLPRPAVEPLPETWPNGLPLA